MVPHLSARTLAILALVGANVIWGSTFVALKPVLDRVPPLTVASLRFAIALAILLPLVFLVGDRPARGRGPLLMGLTGVFLLYLCQNVGLQYSSAANGALIHGGIPVLTALLAAAVSRRAARRPGSGRGARLARRGGDHRPARHRSRSLGPWQRLAAGQCA